MNIINKPVNMLLEELIEIKILVSSPSDVKEERLAVDEVCQELNESNSESNIHLRLIKWENFQPGIDEDPQTVINRQTPEYDIYLGIMWHRFGTSTKHAESGTAEEFERAYQIWEKDKNLKIWFYFKEQAIPYKDLDGKQFDRVQKFRKKIGEKGAFYKTFDDINEFKEVLRINLQKYIWQITKQIIYSQKEIKASIKSESPVETFIEETFELHGKKLQSTNDLEEIWKEPNDYLLEMGDGRKIQNFTLSDLFEKVVYKDIWVEPPDFLLTNYLDYYIIIITAVPGNGKTTYLLLFVSLLLAKNKTVKTDHLVSKPIIFMKNDSFSSKKYFEKLTDSLLVMDLPKISDNQYDIFELNKTNRNILILTQYPDQSKELYTYLKKEHFTVKRIDLDKSFKNNNLDKLLMNIIKNTKIKIKNNNLDDIVSKTVRKIEDPHANIKEKLLFITLALKPYIQDPALTLSLEKVDQFQRPVDLYINRIRGIKNLDPNKLGNALGFYLDVLYYIKKGFQEQNIKDFPIFLTKNGILKKISERFSLHPPLADILEIGNIVSLSAYNEIYEELEENGFGGAVLEKLNTEVIPIKRNKLIKDSYTSFIKSFIQDIHDDIVADALIICLSEKNILITTILNRLKSLYDRDSRKEIGLWFLETYIEINLESYEKNFLGDTIFLELLLENGDTSQISFFKGLYYTLFENKHNYSKAEEAYLKSQTPNSNNN